MNPIEAVPQLFRPDLQENDLTADNQINYNNSDGLQPPIFQERFVAFKLEDMAFVLGGFELLVPEAITCYGVLTRVTSRAWSGSVHPSH